MTLKAAMLAFLTIAAFDWCVTARAESVTRYSLCPKTKTARDALPFLARKFAQAEGATFSDVGPDRERELEVIGSSVLSKTGLPLVVIVVKKEGEYKFSLGNLGLREKFGMAVRVSSESIGESAWAAFRSQLSLEWTLQKVNGGITNDPPCDQFPKLSLHTKFR
jgi:hypothetical protein